MKVWAQFVSVSAGFIILALGFLLKIKFPDIMPKLLAEKLVIRPDSPTIDNFISPPIPIYMQFYFFNVTNSEEILKGAKPKVHQVGPYTYLEKRVKHDLNWTDTTVDYLEKVTFFFQQNMTTPCSEDDMVTTLNPLLITLAAKLSDPKIPDVLQALFKLIIDRYGLQPFITRKVGELLFKGYEEPLLLQLAKYTNDPLHKTGRFGFFFPKNDSDGGKYSINTGAEGLENLQVIETFKDSPTLDYWPEDHCNMINGTTGGQFPQPIVEEKNVSMFSADLCRSLYLSYEKKLEHGGLELLRYSLPYEVLGNLPENQCYCSDNFTCRASLVNLSPCRKGAPVITSTPHFYMGDPDIVSAVEGLNPNKEEHDTYVDVEPNTGVSFAAMKRIQISMPLRRYADLPELVNVQEVILPMLWLNESAIVPLERAKALNDKLTKPYLYVDIICYVLYIVGLLLIVIPIILVVISKYKRKLVPENAPAKNALGENEKATAPENSELLSEENNMKRNAL